MEITVQELLKLEQNTYLLIDMRSEETRAYGMLPGAVPVLPEDLCSFAEQNPGKTLILYCAHGEASLDAAQALREKGFEAYSLAGGISGVAARGAGAAGRRTDAPSRGDESSQALSRKNLVQLYKGGPAV